VSAKTRWFPRGLRCWPSLSLPAGSWWLVVCSHPGHLGELTRIVPFEMVDAVLAETISIDILTNPPSP
jgi:hypothetical protein